MIEASEVSTRISKQVTHITRDWKKKSESHQDPKNHSFQDCSSLISASFGMSASMFLSLPFHVHMAPEFTYSNSNKHLRLAMISEAKF